MERAGFVNLACMSENTHDAAPECPQTIAESSLQPRGIWTVPELGLGLVSVVVAFWLSGVSFEATASIKYSPLGSESEHPLS